MTEKTLLTSFPGARRHLSATRLKTILTIFIATIVVAGSGITAVLVWRVFDEFHASVAADLRWKADRGPRELATSADVALAVGDAQMVRESFGDYRVGRDVRAVVAVNPNGEPLAVHGQSGLTMAQLFSGREGSVQENPSVMWSWRSATIEGQEVGRLAMVISKDRLAAGYGLRNRLMLVAGAGCLVAIIVSLFFVNSYLAPLLRFTEQTLQQLRELNVTLEQRVADRTVALTGANTELAGSLAKLHQTQGELVEASRRAGMADVAITVLHNVGNVLNSVNVSSELLLESVRSSSIEKLDHVATMLRAHEGDMSDFLAHDPKGKRMPPFLIALADTAAEERRVLLREAVALRDNVDHIKNIVSRQQELARGPRVGVIEHVAVDELLEGAFKMVAPSFEKRGIQLTRTPSPGLRVAVDRHKILEVLLNLLTNARQALEDGDGSMWVKVTTKLIPNPTDGPFTGGRVIIEVCDNGSGIAASDLTRLFEQGFTTKKAGHGFGLHGSACAMMEMGGTLRAHSDGKGKGATFVVELASAQTLQHQAPPPRAASA